MGIFPAPTKSPWVKSKVKEKNAINNFFHPLLVNQTALSMTTHWFLLADCMDLEANLLGASCSTKAVANSQQKELQNHPQEHIFFLSVFRVPEMFQSKVWKALLQAWVYQGTCYVHILGSCVRDWRRKHRWHTQLQNTACCSQVFSELQVKTKVHHSKKPTSQLLFISFVKYVCWEAKFLPESQT